jgi:MoaA/NifB/PqqE/SkfB family radical SAM enzyme
MVKKDELDISDWIFFIDGLVKDYKENSKPTIAITSTEPLLYNDLFKFIKHCKENGFPVQVTTNGFLLPKYYMDVIMSDLDELWISMDGTRDIHNKIRGNPKSFNNIVDGLNLIIQSNFRVPKLYFNYTISDKNYFNLTEFMEFINQFPYESVCFSHLNFITSEMAYIHNLNYGSIPATQTCISNSFLSNIDLKYLWKEIQSVSKNYKNVSFSPKINSLSDLEIYYRFPTLYVNQYKKCKIPWRASQIFSNGDVGVSTRCFNLSFGNVKNTRFSEIWNGNEFKSFRKSLSETKNGSFPACTRCCGVFS